MKRTAVVSRAIAIVLAVAALAGCSSRSISDSGYSGRWSHSYYGGELHEYNILGIAPDRPITDEAIADAFAKHAPFAIPKGSKILLIQSGALMPDEPMQTALAKYYDVAPFSGIPERDDTETDLAKSLRLAAARGGYEYIVCYWGVLETAQQDLATKTVSWVPIVGYAVPDETQEMRIRLRVIGVDVRTGNWAMLTPESYSDSAFSARANRRESDQAQVQLLKENGYTAAAEQLANRWGSK